ncbi:MAG: RidA family protein [Bacteroidota bacterium]|nr:RidA family protein [Bacteroidota bacterium]
MNKTVLYTENAPNPIGPYSQGIKTGNMIFLSGQIALNPKTGEMNNNSLEDETYQVMANIYALLKSQDLGWENVVKTTIFLKNMDDFGKVNEIYGSFFKENFPARETIEVTRLPKEARLEISITAVLL